MMFLYKSILYDFIFSVDRNSCILVLYINYDYEFIGRVVMIKSIVFIYVVMFFFGIKG